ncbi:MAG TPA: hypothetical protein VEA80_05720 [Vitreimonas sp.]|uniref:hypothetical protein n=1 Tax=Vitreimonas sp. TaxID=3069702 RepID=UPI002D6E6584|nr:hypothetical protein [Vitreimonas sp.]HYD86950.1 hypothetical protein [Vitreimonas sp.]
MRKLCAALGALVLLATPAWSEPSGFPPTDRTWTPLDLPAVGTTLRTAAVTDLPRMSSPASGVLERLSDPATMSMCRDQSLPAESRMRDCLPAFQALVGIGEAYVSALDRDAAFADDAMRAAEGLLHGADAMHALMNDFVATLDPNDPSYARRMGGVDQAKRGLTTMLNGAITMLTERHLYSDAARARFAAVIAEVYPRMRVSLTAENRAEFERTLQTLMQNDPDPDVRAALTALNAL